MFPPWNRRRDNRPGRKKSEGENRGWTLNITMATRSCRDPYSAPRCKAPSQFGIRSLL